ncbi:MAG: electron transfer flavoprotein subunit beta/FixA family protein [Candidatus Methylomirabilales bacterium]
MRIVVSLKQIIDPELPSSQFKIDPASKRQQPDGHPLVISPYDENALELALQLKTQTGGHVTVLTVGQSSAVSALRKGLAMGADEATLISDPALAGSDAFGISTALARGIQKLGSPDLVLCGCESGDWADRIVGPILAEALGIPCITYVARVEKQNGRLQAQRVVEEGYEIWEVAPPVLLTILSHESNVPRYPKVKDIMAASRRPIPTWSLSDISLEAGRVGKAVTRVEVDTLSLPTRESRCELLEGEPEEQVAALFLKLREKKVI